MGANKNSSQELDLYPKINPMPLSSNSAKTAYIDKLLAFGTTVGTTAEIRNGASKTTSKIDDKNWIEGQFIFS
jgi:hypothetical protein